MHSLTVADHADQDVEDEQPARDRQPALDPINRPDPGRRAGSAYRVCAGNNCNLATREAVGVAAGSTYRNKPNFGARGCGAGTSTDVVGGAGPFTHFGSATGFRCIR